jgi:predicted NBD/HSP70 family sugar kinase
VPSVTPEVTHGAFRSGGKALPGDARRHNRGLVLSRLLHHGPQSRADLARVTRLTAPTVSALVGGLLDDGLVAERGRRAGGTGKPATLLEIVADARHVVCLDLSDHSRFVGGLVNLTGQITARLDVARRGRTGEAAGRLVAELAADLVTTATTTDRPVLGVGVGTPGIVYPGGVVQEASNLGWHHAPLGDELTTALAGPPVHVVNDANAAVLGELRFGGHQGPNLLLVKVGLGVGAGLVLGGRVVEGDESAAGEIGHVVVDEDGDDCACGNRGCLETILADGRLRQQLDGLGPADRQQVLAAAGEHLGRALAPAIGLLNLRTVVVSAPAGLLDEVFRAALVAAVRRRTIPLAGGGVEAELSTTGKDDVLLGVAAVVLNQQLGVA